MGYYFVHTLKVYVHDGKLKNLQYKTKQRLKLSGTGSAQKHLVGFFLEFMKLEFLEFFWIYEIFLLLFNV